MKKSASIFLFSFILSLGCHKNKLVHDNPYGLPNATQTGTWTMGCLINDRPWIAAYNKIDATLDGDTVIGVSGDRNGFFFESIALGLHLYKDAFQLGKPQYLDSLNFFKYITDSTCFGGSSNVTNLFAINGSITVTKLDTINHIFSGIFNCIVAIPGCDTISITEGRFDVPFSVI